MARSARGAVADGDARARERAENDAFPYVWLTDQQHPTARRQAIGFERQPDTPLFTRKGLRRRRWPGEDVEVESHIQ
jgi:hypothetical protein